MHLRRACVLGIAAALALSLPSLTPTVSATPAAAVGPSVVRAEADATANADPTTPVTPTTPTADATADAAGTASAESAADAGATADASSSAQSSSGADASATADGGAADATAAAGSDAAANGADAGTADAGSAGADSGAGAAGGGPVTPSDAEASTDAAAQGEPNDGAPRGPNGGLASNSPGPDNQQTPDGTEQQGMRAFAAATTALIGDNYPAKYKNLPWPYQTNNIWDEWNFAYRQCTSFVSWRLNSANGIPFSNQYGGVTRWGDAGQWAATARSLGIRVDTTPEVGAVAWSGPYYGDASQFGHVAWVADVLSDGRVVIEEYNAGWAGAYSTRTVSSTQFQGYIHIADIMQPFTKTGKATISGVPMVNGTLTASGSGWSPAATSYSYRWMRNGTVITGAKSKTYQPTLADLGTKITVEVTGNRSKYRATSAVSSATAAVLMSDANGDGIDDSQQMLPWNSDVNGDGLPDAVGFGSNGITVALRSKSGFGAAKSWGSGFGTSTGWSVAEYPRTLVDVNGDGRADVVGFGTDGVYVSTSTGSGFTTPKLWVSGFGYGSGWSAKYHPRTLADVNGDGLPDVVGIASDGVYVAINTGKSFKAMSRWTTSYTTAWGWSVADTPRWLEDVNGDGKDDIVGITKEGVYVSLSTGTGFSGAKLWNAGFGANAGWSGKSHPRMLADVNGDGRPDVVGFASDGAYVALNTGSSFSAMTRWAAGFGTASGWLVGKHPRTLADINGDGRADVVGFDESGVTVALSTGAKFAAPVRWSSEFGSSSWRLDRQPRMVTDVNGDGKADIVAFDTGGVRVALSTGSRFSGSQLQVSTMGYSAGGWNVASHPRMVGVQSLSVTPAPSVGGQVRVGEQLTATVATWQPKPIKVTYQWLRNGKAISGATSRTYTLTAADLGASVTFRVSGAKLGYAPVARSSQAYTVARGVLAPANPSIAGTAAEGSTLQARTGTWGPSAVQLSYQWLRNGSPISGATQSSYRLTANDVARRISVVVTGTKAGYTTQSRTSATTKVPGTPALPKSPPFVDVQTSHKFSREISWMYTSGMSKGVKQPTGKPQYQPASEVSREAMAAFLYRLAAEKTYVAPQASPFVDVPVTHKFYREIAWMRATGLSTGINTASGRAYDPSASVSREAMAAFLYRLEAPKGYTPPKTSPFADVPTTHKFYREIAWMYDSGLSTGTRQASGKPLYKPQDGVSREAMAAFLYRLETQG
ncbi:FG-GAP-like repeat-containing protein [Leucobacter musarum]|uniref:FG-GAP-like repeat-containing protein n=1 Tax=Leucobacter musarum TaxID=1930747 RepID=UPI00138ED6BF|nr:FG-GAP-like repeat-containing protein [Leucobacter musarum]